MVYMDSRNITIPVREYENLCASFNMLGKEEIIKDVLIMLAEKEEDIRRYKEKYQQSEVVAQRLQKQLDNCIKNAECHSPMGSQYISLKRMSVDQSDTRLPAPGVAMVSRSLHDSIASRSPIEHEESTIVTSLPEKKTERPEDINIKSLPARISQAGIASPGPSAVLLSKLINDNLKLKAQLDKRNTSKHSKVVIPEGAENTISKLKLENFEKTQRITELLSQKKNTSHEGQCNCDKAQIESMRNKIETQARHLEMDRMIIEEKKRELEELRLEKENTTALLRQYQELQQRQGDDTAFQQLQKNLSECTESRAFLTEQLTQCQVDLEKERQEKELALKNYNTLVNQMKMQMSQGSLSPQPPAYSPVPSYSPISPLSTSVFNSPRILPAEPHSLQTRHGEVGGAARRSPGVSQTSQLDPRLQQAGPRMFPFTSEPRQSALDQKITQPFSYTAPSPTGQPAPKIFKCPRCSTPFTVLNQYRDHIQACLQNR